MTSVNHMRRESRTFLKSSILLVHAINRPRTKDEGQDFRGLVVGAVGVPSNPQLLGTLASDSLETCASSVIPSAKRLPLSHSTAGCSWGTKAWLLVSTGTTRKSHHHSRAPCRIG